MGAIEDKAQELGRILGQTDEYQALKRAHERVEDAKDLRERMDQLSQLARQMETAAAQGTEPGEEQVKRYDALLSEIQADPGYQSVVAAQSNFDKLMLKVNQDILAGIKKGADSRIITLG